MDRTQRDGLLLLLVAAAGYAFFPIFTTNLLASDQRPLLAVPDLGSGFTDMLGILFTLSNAVTYALYIVISGRLLRGHTNLIGASTWSITGTFLTMVAVSLLRGLHWPEDPSQWLTLIAMG